MNLFKDGNINTIFPLKLEHVVIFKTWNCLKLFSSERDLRNRDHYSPSHLRLRQATAAFCGSFSFPGPTGMVSYCILVDSRTVLHSAPPVPRDKCKYIFVLGNFFSGFDQRNFNKTTYKLDIHLMFIYTHN